MAVYDHLPANLRKEISETDFDIDSTLIELAVNNRTSAVDLANTIKHMLVQKGVYV